ncbi:hypothetical protein C7271_02120 [filamentous cyanobacterium CCP5]|nr:hypothetical protein C7271_02120 [filamentous cyanobacterium CCP5]
MKTIEDPSLRVLAAKVEDIAPHLVDCWQATAIVESLGYTDHVIQMEFGFPDALALGRFIYEHHTPQKPSIPQSRSLDWNQKLWAELKTFLTEFSRSFIYALPLLIVLLLGYLPSVQEAEWLPLDLAALVTLTTICSMIASGGFVQAINRRGQFYQQLGEPVYARRICLRLLEVGVLTNTILSLLGTWFGFYRNLFPDNYLILANIYYIALSTLWMLFAILSVFFVRGTMLALVGLASLFSVLRLGIGFGGVEAQLIAMVLTLLAVAVVLFIDFRKHLAHDENPDSAAMPSLGAQVYILLPYFCYGVAYFSFIFLDRVIAGSALKPELGLLFAIDSEYQRSLDLALLVFLFLMPFMEYLSYIFVQYWYKSSKYLSINRLGRFSKRLRDYYQVLISTTVGLSAGLTIFVVIVLAPISWGSLGFYKIILGSVSYLLFSIGLLNSTIFFNLNMPFRVLRCILPGLGVNLGLGYLLANLMNADYAICGLLAGSVVFMMLSLRGLFHIIQDPDYAYYSGGY